MDVQEGDNLMPYFITKPGFTSDEPFYQKGQAMAELRRQRKADPAGDWSMIYKAKLVTERAGRRRK